MNYPGIKTIEQRLNIDKETAKTVRGLMDGNIAPESIESTKTWINQCHYRPTNYELIMNSIDVVLGNYGVEAAGDDLGSSYGFAPKYSYSNAGDIYNCTVILNNETGRFMITDIGAIFENENY